MASVRQDLWLTEPLGGTDDPIDAEMEREDLGLMTSIGYQVNTFYSRLSPVMLWHRLTVVKFCFILHSKYAKIY